jgi:phosphoserine phosphatase RsbU/P
MTAHLGDDDVEDLYDNAPCGNVSTRPDGTIVKMNATLLGWLGYTREQVVGHRTFSDLLSVGGRIYYETHLAPLLRMQGEVGGVALDLRTADGTRLPVLVTSVVKTHADGRTPLVRTTVFDARDRRSYERELLRARREAERDRERLEHLVAGLQRSLLPVALPVPPGTETAAHYHMASADEVGGDFYDLFALPDGRWGFFLGDVCGKGVDAAAVTAMARYTLRTAAFFNPDPATVLATLNTILHQDRRAPTHRHCTVVFGTLAGDGTGIDVTLTSGGHPAPLLLGADGTARYLPGGGGPLVGVIPDATYTAQTLRLGAGDTLLLYTDGVTDARHRAGRPERFGSDALLDLVDRLAPASAAATVAALVELLAGLGAGLDDDAAVMAVGAVGHEPGASRS